MYEYKVEVNKVKLSAFIRQLHPELTDGKLHQYLRENKIKVDGKKVPLNTLLEKGSVLRLYLPDNAARAKTRADYTVVYEDDDLLIVDKNAGIPVIDMSGKTSDTLDRQIYAKYTAEGLDTTDHIPDIAKRKDGVPRPCHRLDTGTSGLVIFAKNAAAEDIITSAIKDKKISKHYLALTYGIPKRNQGQLKHYLVKDALRSVVKAYDRPIKDGREAILNYCVKSSYGNLALLNIELLTGRTHQIRAQLAAIGCPILGDGKYGENAINRRYKLKYQALCAYKLTFPTDISDKLNNVRSKTFIAKKPWWYEIDKI